MTNWKFWKRKPDAVTPVVAQNNMVQGWITLDENGSLFGFHETREEADDTIAYWRERGVTMHIARGEMY